MKKEDGIIVCGLGYGDEGKGTIVDALARRFAPADVVRYNGGPQAGHNVVEPDGRWHCFAQLGAGSFVGESRTILGPKMLVELENLEVELAALGEKGVTDARSRLSIDPRCRLITPMHKFVGRMREIARGDARYGSCGQGVGETVMDNHLGLKLAVGDMAMLARVSEVKLRQAREILDDQRDPTLRSAMAEVYDQLVPRSDPEELLRRYRRILGGGDFVRKARVPIKEAHDRRRTLIFEGAQGALLHWKHGFYPHVTKSDTSCRHAFELRGEAKPFKLGILRAYGHRHGAGPFLTEDESLRPRFDDPLNRHNPWQGAFRVGWLDLPALRYGMSLNQGVDGLALTGLDRLSGLETIRVCASYKDADGRIWTSFDQEIAGTPGWIDGCRPRDWHQLPGWRQDLSGVRRFGDLPANAKAFIRFLESKEGLGAPIEIVSVGPCSDQKLFLNA